MCHMVYTTNRYVWWNYLFIYFLCATVQEIRKEKEKENTLVPTGYSLTGMKSYI